jgi:hypothetical protein
VLTLPRFHLPASVPVASMVAEGKSVYATFLVYKAVRAGRTVMYISDKVDGGLLFNSDGRVEEFSRADFHGAALRKLRKDPNTVVIFDGDGDGTGRPPVCRATTVLVTSPKRDRYKEFAKTGALDLVFPVLSRMEMEDMLQSCFPEQAASGGDGTTPAWVERYEKWGGIPRYVFGLLDDANQNLLESAVSKINLERVADLFDKTEIEDDTVASHRLFHLKPRGEQPDGTFVGGHQPESYVLDRTVLGSRYIRKKVFEAMQVVRSNRLLALLAQPTKGTNLAKF